MSQYYPTHAGPLTLQGPRASSNLLSAELFGVRSPGLERKNFFGMLCFWALAAICLLNLNSAVALRFGVMMAFTWSQFFLSLACLLLFRLKVYRDLGASGRFFLLAVAIYCIVGVLVGMRISTAGLQREYYLLRQIVPTLLVLVACSEAAHHVVVAYSYRTFIRILMAIMMIAVLSIFLNWVWPGLHAAARQLKIITETGRYSGFFANANEAGGACCIAVAIAFAGIVIDRYKLIYIVCIGISVIGSLLTLSRASILIMFLLILLQVLISPIVKRKGVLLAVLLCGGGLAWFFTAGVANVRGLEENQQRRFQTIVNFFRGRFDAKDSGDRVALAAKGLTHCFARPIVGNGLGFMQEMEINGMRVGVHNTFLAVWGDSGIIALAVFLAAIAITARNAWRCGSLGVRTLALGFLFVFVMLCMTSHDELHHRYQSVMLGIVFGSLAGLQKVRRHKNYLEHLEREQHAATLQSV